MGFIGPEFGWGKKIMGRTAILDQTARFAIKKDQKLLFQPGCIEDSGQCFDCCYYPAY